MTIPYAQREVWRVLFPGLFRAQFAAPQVGGIPNEANNGNQHWSKSPLVSPHEVKISEYNRNRAHYAWTMLTESLQC